MYPWWCFESFSCPCSLQFCFFFVSRVPQYALDNAKQLSVAHLCSIILSFARLNFQPSGSEDFFNMVRASSFPPLTHPKPKNGCGEAPGPCGDGNRDPTAQDRLKNPP